jgi:hypothetical protein
VHSDSNMHGGSLLIEFGSGLGTVVAILHGFIGTLVVEQNRVVNVSYVPSRGTTFYAEYLKHVNQVERGHAYIAAAARDGVFQIESQDAVYAANYLREYKAFDPTLGIYAAYAYAQAGHLLAIQSVHNYMTGLGTRVPFDVVMLARRLPDANLINSEGIAPFCPMLTQGWALLGPYLDRLPLEVREARQHLVPSLWLTLQPKALNLLWKLIEKGN